ncbi:hypothetical protein L798_00911 [Zootermopsis nevadensis]|uniref:Uncharacterized protein n=1 Tax=Zootermopsis nevadensis TaxID=136037 RepID=A0A067QJY6_ZOONE|nr:hypothetical protein L798_00911 [Zootermopsis nevadensis]
MDVFFKSFKQRIVFNKSVGKFLAAAGSLRIPAVYLGRSCCTEQRRASSGQKPYELR